MTYLAYCYSTPCDSTGLRFRLSTDIQSPEPLHCPPTPLPTVVVSYAGDNITTSYRTVIDPGGLDAVKNWDYCDTALYYRREHRTEQLCDVAAWHFPTASAAVPVPGRRRFPQQLCRRAGGCRTGEHPRLMASPPTDDLPLLPDQTYNDHHRPN